MSAAVALTPRVRIMVICDEARKSKKEPGVFHLKGVRQTITADWLPWRPSQLCLFLLLSHPRPGTFPGYVHVINERTDRVAYHAHLVPHPEFHEGAELQAYRVPIRCAFPERGDYSVQVWFFQQENSDVLKGELPFSVITRDLDS